MADRTGITEITAPIAAGSPDTPLAVHFANEQQGGLKAFATEQEMQDFAKKYPARLYKSVALVPAADNNQISLYNWIGSKPDGTDGQWHEIDLDGFDGLSFVNADGSTTTGIAILALSGLTLDGNEKDGFTLKVTGGAGAGVTFEERHNYAEYQDIKRVLIGPKLELNALKDDKDGPVTGIEIGVKPAAFEPMHPPSFLAKATSIKLIDHGKDTIIFPSEPITPLGTWFSYNDQLGGVNIQDDILTDDPSVSGGQLTEVLCSVNFENKAPIAGNIKIWLMYHQQGAYLPTGYVVGTDGHPIIREKTFQAGEDLQMLLTGAYYAKGTETITLHVEHSFTGEKLALNPDKTLMCVSQFENGSGASMPRIEFQRRLDVSIIPSVFRFNSNFVKLSDLISGVDKPEADVPTGNGEEFLSQFGINNLAPCKASIDRGLINITDNGTDILDFYLDYLVDNTRTAMMRGKDFTASIDVQNDNDAYNLALFKWTGAKDRPTKIYSRRNNGSLILNSGWSKVKETFITENVDRTLHSYDLNVTIPTDAVNLAFAIYPVSAQDPIDFTLREFKIKPDKDYTGYAEIEKSDTREVRLRADDYFSEYGQNTLGARALRYTLNYNPVSGLPLPIGKLIKGNAPFVLDATKNQVSGSTAGGGEGALKATKDGQVSLSCDYLLWNEQATDTVVDLWWVLFDADGNETKIDGSNVNYTIPAHTTTHGIEKTQAAFVFEIEAGQAVGLRGSANKNDGAFLESTRDSDYMIRPVIDFKELTPIP